MPLLGRWRRPPVPSPVRIALLRDLYTPRAGEPTEPTDRRKGELFRGLANSRKFQLALNNLERAFELYATGQRQEADAKVDELIRVDLAQMPATQQLARGVSSLSSNELRYVFLRGLYAELHKVFDIYVKREFLGG